MGVANHAVFDPKKGNVLSFQLKSLKTSEFLRVFGERTS